MQKNKGLLFLVGMAFALGLEGWGAPVRAQTSPSLAWVARYSGLGVEVAHAVAVDNAGNVYVAGETDGNQNNTQGSYVIVKYDANGSALWIRRYNGPGGTPRNDRDYARALVVDPFGNVYVTGVSVGANGSADYATLKYDTQGNLLWVARYDGPDGGADLASALVVDAGGNVLVTGSSYKIGSSYDYATVKYAPNGDQLWAQIYNGPFGFNDIATDLAVDAGGNVVVTGQSAALTSRYDYATLKYDGNGVILWTARYNGTGNGDDYARALAIDGLGNVYVTGESAGPDFYFDYATLKYSPAGAPLWTRRYDGPGYGNDYAYGIALDSRNNVYVTGESGGVGTGQDYATLKYDTQGNALWAARYNGPGNRDDSAQALAVDGQGNVYVTGLSTGIGTGFSDYATLKYSPIGAPLWAHRYNGPGNGYDTAGALAVDALGNVYVTGYSAGPPTGGDFATLKYASGRFSRPGKADDPTTSQ